MWSDWEWLLHSAYPEGEFLGVGEVIDTSEWMPVTPEGSHADYKLCRKELVDSVRLVAPLTAPQAVPSLYFQSSWNF